MTLLTTTLTAPRTLADTFLALTDILPTLSLDVAEDETNPETYRYTFFLPESEKPAFLNALDTLPATTFKAPCMFSEVDTSIDYIAENRKNFPPLIIGPFFIARNDEPEPAGLLKLDIMPNRAFGSGEHATTTGCLLAYIHLIEFGKTFSHGLDFGCGSAILAIAAAKQNATPFTCIDIDPPSVDIARQNATLNGVAGLITANVGETPPPGQTYNLIFANILLQPLVENAPALLAAMAPGASLILSGFTDEQTEELAECYTALGLTKTWQHRHQPWLAQIWSKE